MDRQKPVASLSIDLDNLWSYLKVHGDASWKNYPSYFDHFIPEFLDLLDELDLSITFFIVGQDAALEKNQKAISEITKRGHEVANHSFHHEPWLHLYSKEEIEKEISDAEKVILDVTGQKPIGFRGPGFTWSPDLLQVLSDKNYLYDSSTLPSFIGPIARMYYFWKSNLSKEDKEERKMLYGSIKEGFRSVKPYSWGLANQKSLLEIPITTIPLLKLPFHMSYLMYLSSYSPSLMRCYFSIAMQACRLTGTAPNFLLHPTDLLGGDQVPEMQFFPGMDLTTKDKKTLLKEIIQKLKIHYELVNMSTRAKHVLKMGTKVERVL